MGIIEKIKTDMESRRKTILLLLLLSIVAYLFFFSEYGLIKSFTVSSTLAETEQRLISAQKTNDSILLEIEKMETDIYTIEKVAREEYGMVKPGEEVFILDSTELKRSGE